MGKGIISVVGEVITENHTRFTCRTHSMAFTEVERQTATPSR